MKKITEKIKHEFLHLLPPVIFFFIAFQIIAFSKALMLYHYGIKVYTFAGVTFGALLVGKVVLLADMLPFINRFPEKPLIYNVLWKSAIYMAASILFRYLEGIIPRWWRTGDFIAAHHAFLNEIIWPHFLAIQLWLSLLLFIYCAGRELTRVIGPAEVRRMFFTAPPRPAA